MTSQTVLQDRIGSLSPGRENWLSKPAEDLPDKVTVYFAAGQTGLLDMRSPRAAHWAGMIDQQQKAGLPVYVEIDPESRVITNLLLPRVYKIQRVDANSQGDLLVRLMPSSAIHLLLRSDPNFTSMRAAIEAAAADGSELLITETRDHHEIIQVRTPDPPRGEPSEPAPAPPEDPPVSESRAADLFSNMRGETCDPCNPSSNCIPFLYPDDGCWIRAHIMCHLMRTGGPDTTTNPQEDPDKVWIDASSILNAPTLNHPDCRVQWGWHVAPTLQVSLSGGGTELQVIDPSLSPSPESKAAWKGRQGDPAATLTDTDWTDYNWVGNTVSVSLSQAHQYMQWYRDLLADRCNQLGPPPYNCIKNCFFIIDRNTFSDDEVEAMLSGGNPAVIQSAFYVVLDGFSPNDLGFTAATMQVTPTLNLAPAAAGMSITANRIEFEDSAHLNRRQRLTWVYDIGFANTNGFTAAQVILTMTATVSTESATGHLYLIQQPNPYEIDGPTSWLSVDLRVFQIEENQSKFGANVGTNPTGFITQVLTNLNAGNTGGQTFDADILTDQQTSRLELSKMVGNKRVYNFAVAKVRYRSRFTSATNVRVFFRLFPVATTSLEYDQATTYRRHTSGSTVVPLLGIKNGDLVAIPCFASPRINSATASLTTQTDTSNLLTMPPDASGSEVVRYFGCWLDINQTEAQFPEQPSPADGPFGSGRKAIQDLIRNEHQCLVSEIAFTPAPAQNGATPSVSDKLAQRNLAIVASANPGLVASRRIPQTFEIRPSAGKPEHDELMIDWGDIPAGSVATLYLPGMDIDQIILLAARRYRSYRLLRIDENTLRLDTGGITYLPLPFVDGNLPGMLTLDLPEGIKKGQAFTVVVRQVTGQQATIGDAHRVMMLVPRMGTRHIVGSFQLTIPVREKTEMLPGQQRLLSNLHWIQRAIPAHDRWTHVFGRYVAQVADRVDALGGDASKVAASPTGHWQEAYRTCTALAVAAALLLALVLVSAGVLTGVLLAAIGVPLLALLTSAVVYWRHHCRPTLCQQLLALLAGAGGITLVLAVLALFGVMTPGLIPALIAGAGIAAGSALVAWTKGCFN